jgi:hypothetical protein
MSVYAKPQGAPGHTHRPYIPNQNPNLPTPPWVLLPDLGPSLLAIALGGATQHIVGMVALLIHLSGTY